MGNIQIYGYVESNEIYNEIVDLIRGICNDNKCDFSSEWFKGEKLYVSIEVIAIDFEEDMFEMLKNIINNQVKEKYNLELKSEYTIFDKVNNTIEQKRLEIENAAKANMENIVLIQPNPPPLE